MLLSMAWGEERWDVTLRMTGINEDEDEEEEEEEEMRNRG
jgi:hypothetical protein